MKLFELQQLQQLSQILILKPSHLSRILHYPHKKKVRKMVNYSLPTEKVAQVLSGLPDSTVHINARLETGFSSKPFYCAIYSYYSHTPFPCAVA